MLICFDKGLENRKRELFSIFFLFLILNPRHDDFDGLLYFTPEICSTLSVVVDTASEWRIHEPHCFNHVVCVKKICI